jgi:hypothetical protein
MSARVIRRMGSGKGAEILSYEKAMLLASRDEAFKATVYAMNTLLVHKGIYTQDEFQKCFVEWMEKEEAKKARARNSGRSIPEFA